MQLLRRNRKIIVILFCMAFLFTSCSTPNSGIVEHVATDELIVQPMSVSRYIPIEQDYQIIGTYSR